jgi:hypothetical protein
MAFQIFSDLDSSIPLTRPDCLFDDYFFLKRHAGHFPHSIYVFNTEIEKGAGLLNINNAFYHPGRGSFGLLPLNGNSFNSPLLLLQQPVYTTSPPELWLNHFQSDYIERLTANGFLLFMEEPSFLIEVKEEVLSLRMDRGNVKRLNKGIRLGVETSLDVTWEPLYQLLSENRAQKGVKLAMSEAEVNFMMQQFPTDCFWFSTRKDGEVIASAFVLQSLPGCWQVVYWGHRPGTEDLSPVTSLANSIYEAARHRDILFLDLGTASLEGKPNQGLIRYKQNLGAVPSRKATFVRHASQT